MRHQFHVHGILFAYTKQHSVQPNKNHPDWFLFYSHRHTQSACDECERAAEPILTVGKIWHSLCRYELHWMMGLPA